ncbi:nuclear transport factor 2 family protein [Streptomyces arenae]|uniref:nuclear transport factor 2 family protein n=1 Tax=Streptomyces arenae TaxID=29301 RepID=UPI00265B12DA|nr:nuclear transport factor 2 family protein [Streptomyces arenae]MCG7206551.1 nuclear transport factor 2 family protein [Streptomyces arenae]
MTDSTVPIDITELPAVIQQFLTVLDTRDPTGVAGILTPQASVTDEGHTHTGIPSVTDWIANAASEFTYTTTPVAAERTGTHGFTLTQHLEGDFPGGSADLNYRFTLEGALISSLVIAP